jgi:hypothetical protein
MRLLDLQTNTSSDVITLVETADISIKLENLDLNGFHLPSRYVCLSHCWGGTKNPHLTTSSYITANRQGIPVGYLPKTFQDAIEMSRALGYRYLRIDSLCIIQDDASDWRFHVTQMVEIYRYADVTLGASSSTDGTGGLFREIRGDTETAHDMTSSIRRRHTKFSYETGQSMANDSTFKPIPTGRSLYVVGSGKNIYYLGAS